MEKLLHILILFWASTAAAEQKSESFSTVLLRQAIVVSDLDASRRFYRDVLGFEVIFDGDITRPTVAEQLGLMETQTAHFVVLKSTDSAALQLPSAMVGLLSIQNPAPPRMVRPNGALIAMGESMMATVTTDIQKVYRGSKSMDLDIFLPPTPAPDGSESEMVVFDPDGVRVHVVERH